MMSVTKAGKGLYMHCLPADITGLSCERGEVTTSVFDRYRVPTYKEASHKPYIMAAMMMLTRFKDAKGVMDMIIKRNDPRRIMK